jgi:hypothetical protein
MSSAQRPQRHRPLAEQHEEWAAHLRRNVVSRRTMLTGTVGAAAGGLLLGPGNWSEQALVMGASRQGQIPVSIHWNCR